LSKNKSSIHINSEIILKKNKVKFDSHIGSNLDIGDEFQNDSTKSKKNSKSNKIEFGFQ
jgi:hypothetical protein